MSGKGLSTEELEALPRYIVLIQDAEGWTEERGHRTEPMMHSAVLLEDVKTLLEDAEEPPEEPGG